MTRRVTVVGAGVVGLTCAVRLAEAGLAVDVLARELPLETSSAAATGLWLPSPGRAAEPAARWATTTLDALRALATDPETGVAVRSGRLLGEAARPGYWPAELEARLLPHPGPGGDVRRVDLPLADLDVYLAHLAGRLTAADGTLTRIALPALPGRGLVVNCTGMAARAMAADPAVRPGRVQTLRLADPGLDGWWADLQPDDPLLVTPHGSHVVVGGPAVDGDYSGTPDPATAARLHERAARLVPELRDAAVLGHRVGVRPCRPSVRLETRTDPAPDGGPGRTVVHCYGHGADGLTLSWGCADDVLAAVRAALPADAAV